jgi:hypothetical protein
MWGLPPRLSASLPLRERREVRTQKQTGVPTPCGGNPGFPIPPSDGGLEDFDQDSDLASSMPRRSRELVRKMSSICKNRRRHAPCFLSH